jgi:hypothetical protein
MPAAVARQRDILVAMLNVIEPDPALRWLELGCSLGRDAGDELSDIDCAVGVAEDRWPDVLELAARLAAAGGPVADTMRQIHPGPDFATCWHVFTLYTDGAQLSLVLMPSTWRVGLPPGSVAVYDVDGRLARPWRPAAADADAATLREWAALGWIALGDLAKYLDRGSLWEAYQRLDEARGQAFKLWAAGSRCVAEPRGACDGKIDFPGYGLTSILDTPGASMPPGVESTVAALDAADLRRAAVACAELLTDAIARVSGVLTGADLRPPDGLRDWVLLRLGDSPPQARS